MTNKLPDQYFNRSNNTQLEDDHFADVGKKVEEAKEELRDFLNLEEDLTLYPDYKKEQIEKLDNCFWRLLGKAQNLLNALDAQKEYSEFVNKEPLFPFDITSMCFSPELIQVLDTTFCNVEQNTKRIEKLERLIKRLING